MTATCPTTCQLWTVITPTSSFKGRRATSKGKAFRSTQPQVLAPNTTFILLKATLPLLAKRD